MVLVDTSVWVAHFRDGNIGLEVLLNKGRALTHAFIVGELACGNLRNRAEILSYLDALPKAVHAEHQEIMAFIENHRLMGKGLGYIDMHLLASAMLSKVPLWTIDKKMGETASMLGISHTMNQ
jgi:predicted nucleic acid-binding protein